MTSYEDGFERPDWLEDHIRQIKPSSAPTKTRSSMQTELKLTVDYDPTKTDPDSLAELLDRLLETVLSTPGIVEEYGDPVFGPAYVFARHSLDKGKT